MITIVAGDREQVRTVRISANFKQGQWGYLNGQDTSGNPRITPVSASGHAAYNRWRLVCVGKATISMTKGDDEYETIYQNNGDSNDDGRLPFMIEGANMVIEDDKLDGNRVAGDFDNANFGDRMRLTVSGYPTIWNATDAANGATDIAYFDNIKGDMVTYVTI